MPLEYQLIDSIHKYSMLLIQNAQVLVYQHVFDADYAHHVFTFPGTNF